MLHSCVLHTAMQHCLRLTLIDFLYMGCGRATACSRHPRSYADFHWLAMILFFSMAGSSKGKDNSNDSLETSELPFPLELPYVHFLFSCHIFSSSYFCSSLPLRVNIPILSPLRKYHTSLKTNPYPYCL